MILSQIASTAGALMILAAYWGLHGGLMKEKSPRYFSLNFFGASLLLYAAFVTGQIGFILLEAAWAGVTVYGLLKAKGVIGRKRES